MNDLSPYELARLERIKRNESRLRELGLFKQPNPTPKTTKPKPATIIVRKRKQPSSAPTRSSRRLRGLKEGKEKVDYDGDSTKNVDAVDTTLVDEDTADYERLPDEPERLDDEEFQVYVSLRAWRLGRKNELEIEPYKICQNRTLCELIRRRRNDVKFARGKEVNEIEKIGRAHV